MISPNLDGVLLLSEIILCIVAFCLPLEFPQSTLLPPFLFILVLERQLHAAFQPNLIFLSTLCY